MILWFWSVGHSSSKKETMFWVPPQLEERARFMSMKKKRKDQRGDTSISRTALGYATKASLMPSVTTSSMGLPRVVSVNRIIG